MKIYMIPLFAVCSCSLVQLSAESGESSLAATGVRLGIDAEDDSIDLVSYELFGCFDMGWSRSLGDHFQLELQMEAALGGLSGEGETAVYGRLAPVAQLSRDDLPLALTLSAGPSLYSEDTFDHYDMGGNFHFTSSVGLNCDFDDAWSIGYRFQHTSNADISDPNPGLEMHTLHIAYTF